MGDMLLSKVFGEGAPDAMAALKKDVEKVELQKRKAEAEKAYNKAVSKDKTLDDRMKELQIRKLELQLESGKATKDIKEQINEIIEEHERGNG